RIRARRAVVRRGQGRQPADRELLGAAPRGAEPIRRRRARAAQHAVPQDAARRRRRRDRRPGCEPLREEHDRRSARRDRGRRPRARKEGLSRHRLHVGGDRARRAGLHRPGRRRVAAVRGCGHAPRQIHRSDRELGDSMSDDDKVKKLLAEAHDAGALSAASLATLDVVDVGAQIQAGLGIAIDDVAASEVVLLTMMPDDSQSIAAAGNTDAVRDGHNLVIDALRASKQSGEVLAHTRYLNGYVLCPYTALDHAVAMTPANYDPRFGTPLFDQTAVLLG